MIRKATPGEIDALARLWHGALLDGHATLAPPALVRARTRESFAGRREPRACGLRRESGRGAWSPLKAAVTAGSSYNPAYSFPLRARRRSGNRGLFPGRGLRRCRRHPASQFLHAVHERAVPPPKPQYGGRQERHEELDRGTRNAVSSLDRLNLCNVIHFVQCQPWKPLLLSR